MGMTVAKVSENDPEIARMKAEIERLKQQLEQAKPRNLEFLGEVIPAEILPELTGSGKLSARAAKTRGEGMHGDGGNLWLRAADPGCSVIAGRARAVRWAWARWLTSA